MADDTSASTGTHPISVHVAYQIIAQTVLGVVGVGGYIGLLVVMILHTGDWTTFQQNQISAALGFLAGTVVACVFNYAFGSSFSPTPKPPPRP